MRLWLVCLATMTGALLFLAGCDTDTSSTGFAGVTVTDEDRENVAGNQCAVKGHATNAGNNRARVRLTYEGKNSQGTVIATSTAEFEVAPFSNFDFSNTKLNNQGQPSSSVFSPPVSCSAIADLHRKDLDVDAI
jgi:hypothetical protein